MTALEPHFSVTCLEDRGEVHFTASGFWTLDTIHAFESTMAKTLGPLVQAGKKLRFLSDLRGLVPQDKMIANEIERLIELSLAMGNERTAIVADSTLTAIQHRRLNRATNQKVFESKTSALEWLRA